jgi:signal transduction histidine kinase
MISANKMEARGDEITEYQGIIKDISKEKEIENLVIRTILNTQERERERFARDLHDSLGQQLSGIKFFLETLKLGDKLPDKKQNEMLAKSGEAINHAIEELRNICFNLMPRALESFGLKYAIEELCDKMEFAGTLKFNIIITKNFPSLEKSLEIAVFRIVQEFINNSIKHGKTKTISITMKLIQKKVYIVLKDDGIGFNQKKLSKNAGMGLKNVQSRITSYDGEVKIESAPNKGTTYRITIPI